ncbi:5'-methylthioadenosine/adenosylhomocysteine nucleosidase [Listeria kieliensis]|uniref:5'-methylthioadenosine/S-adenosylhomocysteine nucleosidase n=1 Tax=Listeria kieliensis TaxID=1621700 RepID=A0A3D8TUY9_9LIST|nr:5'-methylthioadenosine/adenosylhomocysteine nucleosidase [Listeria kieliensis]RDX02828.1 5'-methylthioadenosine nucleosidase [Listeria kieliensis]
MMIGIIGAMQEEVQILRDAMTERKTVEIAGAQFYEGNLEGQRVVLVESGIGKVNAAVSTAILCDRYAPKVIINTGSAGGIGSDLKVGDVILSDRLTYGDVDATVFGYRFGQVPQMPAIYEGDRALLKKAEQIYAEHFKETPNKAVYGLVVTNDSFISQETQREALFASFPDMCAVEMEAAAIAQVAYRFQVPFLVIRAISDVADQEAAMSFDEFLEIAAKASSESILALLRKGI